MNVLARDIRKLLADRIQSASAADLFAILTSICANDETQAPAAAEVTAAKSRFTKLDLNGFAAPNTPDWVAVYDAETNLTWTRTPLNCGAVSHKDAIKACVNYRLFGHDDWHAPTVKQRVSIADYTKFGPALYPEFDAGTASYEWTSEVDAEDPSGFAWGVNLLFGNVSRFLQSDHGYVRAVRVGQPLSLGL